MPKPSEDERKETAALWAEYKTNPTRVLREKLLEKYTPLVYKIANKYTRKRPSVLDYDDLVQAGRMGLLDAIEKFDPNNANKAQFQTYARFRVEGSILDEINDMDWTPRSVRQNIKKVLLGIEHHYNHTSHEPTVEDIASRVELGIDETKQALIQMNKTYVTQVDNEIIEIVGPSTDAEHAELKSIIKVAMDKVLTEKEKDFIIMKYFSGFTNREIQEVLGLKASELKTLREDSLFKLTSELEDPDHYNAD